MAGSIDVEVLQIAGEIERYLKSHPHSADTLEGITKWWLPGQGIEVSSLMVQQALDYLGSKSVVKCTANIGGNNVYSSNKAK